MVRRCVAVVLASLLAVLATGCNNANKFKARGIEKLQARQYGDAIQEFDKAIGSAATDAELYYYRAYAWLGLKDSQQAVTDLDRAIRINPNYSEARILRGHARCELGDLDQALSDLNEAVRMLPDNDRAYHSRGLAFMAKGEYAKALADFDRVITISPTQSHGYNNRAWLRATAGDASFRDARQAIADATKAGELLAEGEERFAFLDTLAAAYAEAGQFDKAVESQQQAIDLAPSREVPDMKSHLELYKSGKPYRVPAGKSR